MAAMSLRSYPWSGECDLLGFLHDGKREDVEDGRMKKNDHRNDDAAEMRSGVEYRQLPAWVPRRSGGMGEQILKFSRLSGRGRGRALDSMKEVKLGCGEAIAVACDDTF